jgi:hypothetical protein
MWRRTNIPPEKAGKEEMIVRIGIYAEVLHLFSNSMQERSEGILRTTANNDVTVCHAVLLYDPNATPVASLKKFGKISQ